MLTHKTIISLAGFVIAASVATSATAADWPGRTITLIVPYSAGG